jgi:serine/threonine protein kinase
VVNDNQGPLRKFRLRTSVSNWSAPEHGQSLDSEGLKKTDVYSFGLLSWRIMLNGDVPWKYLTLKEGDSIANTRAQSDPSQAHISENQFRELKLDGDSLLELAVNTISDRKNSDVDFDYAFELLSGTLKHDPIERTWMAANGQGNSMMKPLCKGDFQLKSINIYKVWLATCLEYP